MDLIKLLLQNPMLMTYLFVGLMLAIVFRIKRKKKVKKQPNRLVRAISKWRYKRKKKFSNEKLAKRQDKQLKKMKKNMEKAESKVWTKADKPTIAHIRKDKNGKKQWVIVNTDYAIKFAKLNGVQILAVYKKDHPDYETLLNKHWKEMSE